jgi:hypothetical protein
MQPKNNFNQVYNGTYWNIFRVFWEMSNLSEELLSALICLYMAAFGIQPVGAVQLSSHPQPYLSFLDAIANCENQLLPRSNMRQYFWSKLGQQPNFVFTKENRK